ncbi:MAG: hypothetical protein V1807_02955, partial [Patescibacteria group bacterium]
GLKVDLPGGSPTLKEAIAEVQKKFPAPASSDQPSQNKKAPRGRVKPEEATLRTAISAIEKRKPRPNLIKDLESDNITPAQSVGNQPPVPPENKLEENEWISLKDLKKQSDQPPKTEQ